MIKFGYTIFYVTDVTKSIEFYEQAFGFTRKFITPEGDYGEMLTGETTISFASTEFANSNLEGGFIQSEINNQPFGIEIGLLTPDVSNAITKAIAAGAKLISEPTQKPWGQTVAYIRDINGFLVEICTPMG